MGRWMVTVRGCHGAEPCTLHGRQPAFWNEANLSRGMLVVWVGEDI